MGDNGDHGPGWGDLGGLLFGYLVYREIRDGRLDPDDVFRAGCLLAILAGVVVGGVLLLAAATMPPRGYDSVVYPAQPTLPAFVAPVSPTSRPAASAKPSPTPAKSPKPAALPGIGDRVNAKGGWAVTVTKVQRWTPGWYDEPGWRLVTTFVKVRMPANDDCVWGDMFVLQARSGRTYVGFLDQRDRRPHLFDCADYHRKTTATGWVTFEVREKDAKGLVLAACPGEYFGCDPDHAPVRIRLKG